MKNTFTFPITGQSVRVVKQDNEPWFVATEVAEILGYTNPRKAIRDHCKYTKLFKRNESAFVTSSPYGINMIPEQDVYRLIMRSNLPAAEKFQSWVVRDVLPAIRKDGAYIMGEEKVKTGEMAEEELILNAMTILQGKVARLTQEKAIN